MTQGRVNISEIRARCEKASPGPWVMEAESGNIGDALGSCVIDSNYGHYAGPLPSLEFIAHARADIPALLARVEELESAVEKAAVTIEKADFISEPILVATYLRRLAAGGGK